MRVAVAYLTLTYLSSALFSSIHCAHGSRYWTLLFGSLLSCVRVATLRAAYGPLRLGTGTHSILSIVRLLISVWSSSNRVLVRICHIRRRCRSLLTRDVFAQRNVFGRREVSLVWCRKLHKPAIVVLYPMQCISGSLLCCRPFLWMVRSTRPRHLIA